jgi:hypothetical protein
MKKIHEMHTDELIRAVVHVNAINEKRYHDGDNNAVWFDSLPDEDEDGEDDRAEWECLAVELGM